MQVIKYTSKALMAADPSGEKKTQVYVTQVEKRETQVQEQDNKREQMSESPKHILNLKCVWLTFL